MLIQHWMVDTGFLNKSYFNIFVEQFEPLCFPLNVPLSSFNLEKKNHLIAHCLTVSYTIKSACSSSSLKLLSISGSQTSPATEPSFFGF